MRTHPHPVVLLLVAAVLPAAAAEGDVRVRLDAAVVAASGEPCATAVDDAGYLRRVWLDLAGHVPPALVAREFLDDRDPAKRGG